MLSTGIARGCKTVTVILGDLNLFLDNLIIFVVLPFRVLICFGLIWLRSKLCRLLKTLRFNIPLSLRALLFYLISLMLKPHEMVMVSGIIKLMMVTIMTPFVCTSRRYYGSLALGMFNLRLLFVVVIIVLVVAMTMVIAVMSSMMVVVIMPSFAVSTSATSTFVVAYLVLVLATVFVIVLLLSVASFILVPSKTTVMPPIVLRPSCISSISTSICSTIVSHGASCLISILLWVLPGLTLSIIWVRMALVLILVIFALLVVSFMLLFSASLVIVVHFFEIYFK